MNKKLIVLLVAVLMICGTMEVMSDVSMSSNDAMLVESIRKDINLRNKLRDLVETLLKQWNTKKEYIDLMIGKDMPDLEQARHQKLVDLIWEMRTKHSDQVRSNPKGCAEQIIEQVIGAEPKIQVVQVVEYSEEDILKLAEEGAEFYRFDSDIDGTPVYVRKSVSVQQRSPLMENIFNNSVEAQAQKIINNTASNGLKEAMKEQRIQGDLIDAGIINMAGRQHENAIKQSEEDLANAEKKAKDAVKNAREEKKADASKTGSQQSSTKKDNQKAGNTQIPDSSNPKGNNTPNPLDPNTDDIDDPLLPPDYKGTSPQSTDSFPEGNNIPNSLDPNMDDIDDPLLPQDYIEGNSHSIPNPSNQPPYTVIIYPDPIDIEVDGKGTSPQNKSHKDEMLNLRRWLLEDTGEIAGTMLGLVVLANRSKISYLARLTPTGILVNTLLTIADIYLLGDVGKTAGGKVADIWDSLSGSRQPRQTPDTNKNPHQDRKDN